MTLSLFRIARPVLASLALTLILSASPRPATAQAPEGDALAAADRALFNGDYATAISGYMAAVGDPALKCEALHGLGVTYSRAGLYPEADTAFAQHLGECPPAFETYVLRGLALQQLGRNDEALAAFQQAQAINPVLDSYLYERMAALVPDQATYYLRLAADSPRHPEGKFALRERLAEMYVLAGSPDMALATYDTILREIADYLAVLAQVEGAEFDRDGALRARLESAAADIEIQGGQPAAGYARLQRVITDYWQTDFALPALITLVTANQPVDLLYRMRINVRNENFGPVVGVLVDYLNNPANAGAPAELHLLLGQAQRGLGNHADALATFARLRQQHPQDPASATAALEQGLTYLDLGDTASAITAFAEVASAYPQSPEAPRALLLAADTERQFGDITRALAFYDQLAAQYPQSEQARDGLLAAGMALRAIDPLRVADLFARVGSARGYVWQGKVLAEAGQIDAARQAWTQGAAAEPGTYFSIRACELLLGRQPFQPASRMPVDTSGDRAAAEAWVAQTFNLPGVSADLAPELAADPMLQRGVALWSVGLWGEARAELDALHRLHRDDPAALLQLAFYYQSVPIYRSSLLAATRLVYHSNQPLVTIPDAVLRLAWPVYYADLLIPLAEQRGLDPLLVAALIRQESSFDPTVTSPANARGLMQFVPATAQDVATQLGWPDYTLDDLYRPIVSITFGTHYLSAMRAFQGGSDAGALLSYNAGPGAAQVWVNEAGNDLEALYEAIDYAETRAYLDFIYSNYFLYQRLYADGAPDCWTA